MSAYAVVLGATLIWLAAVVSPGPNFLVVSRLALSRPQARKNKSMTAKRSRLPQRLASTNRRSAGVRSQTPA